MTTPLTSISLFTGAGGLDLGLERAGFQTKVAVEIDSFARDTLSRNSNHFKNEFPILSDITAIKPAEILEKANLQPGDVTLVSGGPPCQSFSTAGKRHSLGDPRGSLFKNYADVVEFAKPRFFVMENVRGLLSAAIKHRPLNERGLDFPPLGPEERQGSAFQVIRSELEDRLGYQLTVGLVNAADYGVPQNRLRVIAVGSRDHELTTTKLEQLMPPSHEGNWNTLGSVLKEVAGTVPEFLNYSIDRANILARVPPGKNWRWFRDNPDYGAEFTKEIMGGAWSSGGGKVGFFRRLNHDKPSPTLPTSPIQKSTSLCHPDETRPLSVQEYAAIQQFPCDYDFAGSIAQKYKQIGNAVPVGLGEAVGGAVIGAINNSIVSGQIRLMEGSEGYSAVES